MVMSAMPRCSVMPRCSMMPRRSVMSRCSVMSRRSGVGVVAQHAAMGVVCAYWQHPAAGMPGQRMVEIADANVAAVLHAVQHLAQVAVASLPPGAAKVAMARYVHQVIQVDAIHCLILGFSQS